MPDRTLVSEQERAVASVTQRELELRQAQEGVRTAGEMLRRAIRASKAAEGDLSDAERRLDRLAVSLNRVG